MTPKRTAEAIERDVTILGRPSLLPVPTAQWPESVVEMSAPKSRVYEFVVPGRAVPWARAGRAGKRTFTPKRSRAYAEHVQSVARIPMLGIGGACALTVTAVYARPKKWGKNAPAGRSRFTARPDADNVGKAIMDALKPFWTDDRLVTDLRVTKWYASAIEPPHVHVRIELLP